MRQLNYHQVVTPTGPLPMSTPIAVNARPDATSGWPAFTGKMVADGVLVVAFSTDTPVGGATFNFQAQGFLPIIWRDNVPPSGQTEGNPREPIPNGGPMALSLEPSAFPFPPAGKRSPLPPFDQSDSFGQVHTTPPTELVIPIVRDPLFMRADFNGVTLPGLYEPRGTDSIIRNGGVTFTSGPYVGKFLPFLVGANTTPPTMIMTTMLVLYPRWVQDACLALHASYGYTHLVWSPTPWNSVENRMSLTQSQVVAWAQYLKSLGFYSVAWRGDALISGNDPLMQALVSANCVDFAIVGEEMERHVTAEQYEEMLDNYLAGCLKGIPSATHFSSNYPEGFPKDTMITNWDKYNGRLHLAWQADQTQSAGQQGAMLGYARRRVNLGQVGGNGGLAPDSRVYAFEVMATAQLYGQCTEDYGNLRSLELLYCPANGTVTGCRGMSGAGNGVRDPDGGVLWPAM